MDTKAPILISGSGYIRQGFMSQKIRQLDALGAGILIGISALLGLNQVLVKLVNVGMAPVFQVGMRSACAFLPVLAWSLLRKKRLSITDGTFSLGLLNGVFFSLEFCLLFSALEYTSVARVSLFFYTMPFWVALGAHFLIPGDSINRYQLSGLTLAGLGVYLVFSDVDSQPSQKAWIGDCLSIAAAICWAAIALLTRTTRLSTCTPEMNLLYQLGFSSLVLIPIAVLSGDTFREMDFTITVLFASQVIFITCFAFLTWFWALSVYPINSVASFGLLTPISGVFFGWLILDDIITYLLLVALVLIAGGLVLVNARPQAQVSIEDRPAS